MAIAWVKATTQPHGYQEMTNMNVSVKHGKLVTEAQGTWEANVLLQLPNVVEFYASAHFRRNMVLGA